jgi:plasmid replication initiation protein
MVDELRRLRDQSRLLRLLEHYARTGAADRDAWQDRLMHMDDLDARGLTKLHGELLACEWLEQNSGVVPRIERGMVPGCYRITVGGLRALKRAAQAGRDTGEEPNPRAA